MKSKYCFIRNLSTLDVGSFILHVWVGSSLREHTTLSKVEKICKANGYYLQKWSVLVHSRLDKERDRFLKNGYAIADPFRHAQLSISKLLSLLVRFELDEFESSIRPTPQEIWYRHHHDPIFILKQNLKNSNTTCLPSVSKYLRPSEA